jgi:cobalt-zinc-cadmium efflux system membrane fusion protein
VVLSRKVKTVTFSFVWLTLGALSLGAVSAGCKHPPPPSADSRRQADRSVVLGKESEAYLRIEPALVASKSRVRPLAARISFDERHFARVGSPVQGRVLKLSVLTGDDVKKDAVIALLAAPDVAGVQAQVAETRGARALAEHTAERMRTLAKQGAGSEAEAQAAETALEQAKLEEKRASQALNALGGALGTGTFEVRAPIAGTVVERPVSVGSQVSLDQDRPIVVVADLSRVWVLADVYEQDLPNIAVGDDAEVHVLSLPDRTFSGKVTDIGKVLDPLTRSARARIELPNDDRALRPGMFAQVQAKGAAKGAAEIPTSALLARRDQFFVFVKRPDGAYEQREVKLGEQHGQHVMILSGIEPGVPVVTEGAILLDVEANEAL